MTAPGPRAAAGALVLGGSGAVGAEVVRALRAAGVPTCFQWHQGEARASRLAEETGARPYRVDLTDSAAIRALTSTLEREGFVADRLIHCAAAARPAAFADVTDEDWQVVAAVGGRSAFVACQALAPLWARLGEAHVVLVGALDRTQSLPIPVHFAAAQGTLSALAMALAKELGPSGVRVNLVALGLLDAGLGGEIHPRLVADYKSFSALRRVGQPVEAARAILWLALENTYMTGKVLSVNGGL